MMSFSLLLWWCWAVGDTLCGSRPEAVGVMFAST